MIVRSSKWKSPWLVEEGAMLLQKGIQQRVLVLGGCGGQLEMWHGWRSAPNAVPPDFAAQPPECHRERVEVPQDGPEGPEKVHAEDEVEAAEVDACTGNGKVFAPDGDGNVAGESMTLEAI